MANDIYRRTTPRGSIEYVRLNKIKGFKIEEEQLVYGSVILSDGEGQSIVYHRPTAKAESIRPGEHLSLTGPPRPIEAGDSFRIRVFLWVKFWDPNSATQITKEIACGEISWDRPDYQESIGKRVKKRVRGKHGSVTVAFSVIGRALTATVKAVMMGELPAQIYGTIKAVRLLESSRPITEMLLDKPENECVQLSPHQSMPLARPVFPVRVDSDLTIHVDLWNHANDRIARGDLQFTPIYWKTTTAKYGQVEVSVTCK